MPLVHRDGFSTAVRIHLEVGGTVLPVAQVGDNSLILREPFNHPPTEDAQVVITVDGQPSVALRDGISGTLVYFDNVSSFRLS